MTDVHVTWADDFYEEPGNEAFSKADEMTAEQSAKVLHRWNGQIRQRISLYLNHVQQHNKLHPEMTIDFQQAFNSLVNNQPQDNGVKMYLPVIEVE